MPMYVIAIKMVALKTKANILWAVSDLCVRLPGTSVGICASAAALVLTGRAEHLPTPIPFRQATSEHQWPVLVQRIAIAICNIPRRAHARVLLRKLFHAPFKNLIGSSGNAPLRISKWSWGALTLPV
jgi:hypothetical protein